jgi:hypothetical protein
MGQAAGSVAWAKAAATAMTEEDHRRFGAYTGAPASTWFWMVRP